MIDRKIVKQKGHVFLKNNLITAILVCLFIGIVSGIFEIKFNNSPNEEYLTNDSKQIYYVSLFDSSSNPGNSTTNNIIFSKISDITGIDGNNKVVNFFIKGMPIYITATTIIVITIFAAILRIFLYLPLMIGQNKYFLDGAENIDGKVPFSTIFTYFKNRTFADLALKVLVIGIKIFLWTLLLIIPGIVKSYQYYFTGYILAENPEISQSEAIKISTKMTDDNKFDLFIFDLSFILWHLLSIFLLGIPYLYVTPYINSSKAYLYLDMKNKMIEQENLNTNLKNEF